MPYAITLDEENTTILLSHKGEVSIWELRDAREEVGNFLAEKNWKKLMIDLRLCSAHFERSEFLAFAYTHDIILNQSVKIAVLLAENPESDFWRVHQDIVKGWGITLEFFYLQAKAFAWFAQEEKDVCDQSPLKELTYVTTACTAKEKRWQVK